MGKHWLDGIYLSQTTTSVAVKVRGEQVTWSNLAEFDYPDYVNKEAFTGTWKYGKYQEATKEIFEATGEKFYNMEMNYMDGKMVFHGTVSEDGKVVRTMDFAGTGMDSMKWTDSETLKEILDRKFEIKDFWKIIDENEKTHLITRGEKDKEEYSYINIPIEGGYFLNKTVGFEYGKKEELYLKYIGQQRIRWKKMKFKIKEINSTQED